MAPDGGFERNGAQWNGKDFEDMKPEDNMGGRRGRGMNRQGTGEL